MPYFAFDTEYGVLRTASTLNFKHRYVGTYYWYGANQLTTRRTGLHPACHSGTYVYLRVAARFVNYSG
jgi:hypothetical protein